MEIRPEYQIKVAIKALVDTILPAISNQGKHIVEQGQLVHATLAMALKHMPLMYEYDLVELDGFVKLGDQLLEIARDLVPRDESDALLRATQAGRALLQGQRAPAQLLSAVLELRAASGRFVSAAWAHPDAEKVKALSRAVLEHSDLQLLRERSFVADQGWEPAGTQLPPIEDLIRNSPGNVSND